MYQFDTVIISDLHLGARNARCQDVVDFLAALDVKRLIVNGDLFQDPQLSKLRECDVEVIEALRFLGQTVQIDWLVGNHDPDDRWLSALLHIEAQDELVLDIDGRRYLVCHGHRWDSSLQWPWWIVGTAEAVYSAVQWLDPSHRVARFLKHKSKAFCRAVDRLRQHAVRAARARRLDGVILGHTHVATDQVHEGIHYLNSGCWTEQPNGFVGIRDGVACTFQWQAGECRTLNPLSLPVLEEATVLDDPLVATA
ncbi:MAG: UDP-2,3-diacylglucosamine diphosphatase [Planctomycetaceae bacterium]|nr:UDP-2,3-diacylglucosamine diphosphatase [Planctomycetaceae bacterium]